MALAAQRRISIAFNRLNHETGQINTMQDLAFRDNRSPRIMAEGGAGSGKTFLLCMKLLKLSKQNKGVDGGVLNPDYALFNRDVRETFAAIAEKEKFDLPYNGHRHFYTFPWGGAKLWVFSADTRFPGANLGWGGVNEFSIIQKDKLEEFVERRIRLRCPVSQSILVGTPDDPFGYIDDITKKWTEAQLLQIYRGSARLNSHNLKVGYIEEKQKTLDPMAFKLWVEGLRVVLNSEAFYYAYSEANTKALQRQPGQLVHVGMDFNVDNMHAEMAHVVGGGAYKEAQFFHEIVLKERGADTDALCRAVKEWNNGTTQGLLITCDAAVKARRTSGFADLQVIQKHGFQVRFNASNPRLRERQLRANGMFYNRMIWVDKEKCPVLHYDLLRCPQDKATMEKKKDKKGVFSHASDGMDYILSFEFPDLDLQSRSKFRQGKSYGEV